MHQDNDILTIKASILYDGKNNIIILYNLLPYTYYKNLNVTEEFYNPINFLPNNDYSYFSKFRIWK